MTTSLSVNTYGLSSPVMEACSAGVLVTKRSIALGFSQPEMSSLITPCCRKVNRQPGRARRTISGGRMIGTSAWLEIRCRAFSISSFQASEPCGTTRR
jgi:hypothetical protein